MTARSYQQYCGLARALDVVGDRWNLLIVRELLVRPSRYHQLAEALPGVASNLLAGRLRDLVAAGVIERRLDPHRNGALYALTPWGAELREPVEALIRWSAPLMAPGPGGDAFRGEWLLVALRALLHGRTSRTSHSTNVATGDTVLTVRIDRSGPQVTVAPPSAPVTFRADPDVVLGLAAGALTIGEAIERGVLLGDVDELASVFPGRPVTAAP